MLQRCRFCCARALRNATLLLSLRRLDTCSFEACKRLWRNIIFSNLYSDTDTIGIVQGEINMKKIVVVLGLFLSMASYAEEQSNVINAVSSVVSGVVSTGKDVLKGVKEGIDTGRKDGTSIDNAFIISDREQFEKNIKAEVLSVIKDEEGYKVTVALKNQADQFIRITNLNEQESLQLLDSDGFSVFSSCPVRDINIPKKSAVKSIFRFPADGTPKTLKIFEIEIGIPKDLIK